jgi:hypothetical protein
MQQGEDSFTLKKFRGFAHSPHKLLKKLDQNFLKVFFGDIVRAGRQFSAYNGSFWSVPLGSRSY